MDTIESLILKYFANNENLLHVCECAEALRLDKPKQVRGAIDRLRGKGSDIVSIGDKQFRLFP